MPKRRTTFLLALVDTRFEDYATAHLIRGVYGVALMLVSMQCCFWFLFGWSMTGWRFGSFTGWVMMLSTPVVWVTEVAAARIALEYAAVVFRISDDVRAIRDREE